MALKRLGERLSRPPGERVVRKAGLSQEQQDALDFWAKDYWNFLTGVDPLTGRQMIWTQEQRGKGIAGGEDGVDPVRPFPSHLTFLRDILNVVEGEELVFITKPRQMMCSTILMLYVYWLLVFRDFRRVLLSKSSEDEAKEMIEDKIRWVHQQTPKWFQAWVGMTERPKGLIQVRRTNSRILAVGENVATAEARGGTSSLVVIDEAEFQVEYGAILGAAIPQCDKIVSLSTPNPETAGARIFETYLEPDGEDFKELGRVYPERHGLRVKRNSQGFAVVELDYWADPDKDEKWADRMRKKLGTRVFRREILRDRSSSAGDPFYPEFSAEVHVLSVPSVLPDLYVDRGWDFGWRTPAVIWSIYSPEDDRLWAIRELCPRGVDTYSLVALVQFLSGEIPIEGLRPYPRAEELLELIKRAPAYPPPPWFRRGTRFRDFAGPEANKIAAQVHAERAERTDGQVLASLGVRLSMQAVTIEARENVLRRLLMTKADGWPGLLIDPSCPVLQRAFAGGLTFSKTDPRKPNKDGVFENPHDALGYTATQVAPLTMPGDRGPGGVLGRQLSGIGNSLISKETAAWTEALRRA